MRIWVQSLALLSGLRIRCCCELWCRLQIWLGSYIAMAMVQAGNCSSDLTPSLGTSICLRCDPKKQKKKKKKEEKNVNTYNFSNQRLEHLVHIHFGHTFFYHNDNKKADCLPENNKAEVSHQSSLQRARNDGKHKFSPFRLFSHQ